MNLFKKLSPKPQNEAVPKSIITNYSYGEIPVEVEYNIDASMERLPYDFETLKKEGIDNIIKERFIPWLKTDEFRDRDGELIFKGLKLYSIVYCYAMIDARYSHSNQQEMAGQFDFFIESGNEFSSDMMESVDMQIYVLLVHIVKVDGYEV